MRRGQGAGGSYRRRPTRTGGGRLVDSGQPWGVLFLRAKVYNFAAGGAVAKGMNGVMEQWRPPPIDPAAAAYGSF